MRFGFWELTHCQKSKCKEKSPISRLHNIKAARSNISMHKYICLTNFKWSCDAVERFSSTTWDSTDKRKRKDIWNFGCVFLFHPQKEINHSWRVEHKFSPTQQSSSASGKNGFTNIRSFSLSVSLFSFDSFGLDEVSQTGRRAVCCLLMLLYQDWCSHFF